MELMLFDLIAGFFLRLFFIICWKVARFTVHHAWGAVVHHPFLVAIAFGAARRAGWFDDSAAVVFWAPYVIACLLLCAGIRVLSHHPPKDIAEAAKRHVREVQKWGAGVNTAREWVADRRRASWTRWPQLSRTGQTGPAQRARRRRLRPGQRPLSRAPTSSTSRRSTRAPARRPRSSTSARPWR